LSKQAICVIWKVADSSGWLEFARFGESSDFSKNSADDVCDDASHVLSANTFGTTGKTDLAGRS
jgi:hypothetical protein